MRLKNKVAIVTGAGQGIGLAAVQLFVEEGAIVIAADKNPAHERQVLEAAGQERDRVAFMCVDVSKAHEVRNMIDKTIALHQEIHILFNNAGIGFAGKVEEMTEEEWDLHFDVNMKGQFLCSRYAIPYMKKTGGSIINMSSVLGYMAIAGNAAYCASKAAVIGFTKALALEVARDGIRVNALVPGSIDTSMMWDGIAPADLDRVRKEVAEDEPIGRVGRSREIAKAALFLAAEDSSFATGAPFIIDGGLLAKLAASR